jgi:hypothetical protein
VFFIILKALYEVLHPSDLMKNKALKRATPKAC